MKKKKRIPYVRLPKNSYGKYVHIECIICKEMQTIRVNDESIYTEEVRKNYKCWKCKYKETHTKGGM
jgi:hypothetical protein